MTIGRLAAAGAVGVETVRFYPRRGRLPVPERANGQVRRYHDADLARLRFIGAARAAGVTLDAIAELLALDRGANRARARALAAERLLALDARIAELRSARDALARLAAACARDEAGPCPIIAAFEG